MTTEEVNGCRQGGHNQPAYNDDGPCLLEAANALLGQPAEDRVLVVVSDGLPEGRHSKAADLHATIAALDGEPLRVIGLGLGPSTEHVAQFYPQSAASIPLERFADEIAALIQRWLQG